VTAERVRLVVPLLLLVLACEGGFLPLRGKIEIGRDPMVVFVGGPATSSDLYALPASGGRPLAITFSPVAERRPAPAPDGGAVAFLRAGAIGDSTAASVWVLNLLNGAERRIDLPEHASPEQVAWWGDGRSVVVRAGGRLYRAPAPPDDAPVGPIGERERAPAESTLSVFVGKPAFARVLPCDDPMNLCVTDAGGAPSLLAAGAREPFRWGDDSVAYLKGDRLVVRPVGPGRSRTVEWNGAPERPRQFTMFEGASEPR
jgi:hypothetical protein